MNSLESSVVPSQCRGSLAGAWVLSSSCPASPAWGSSGIFSLSWTNVCPTGGVGAQGQEGGWQGLMERCLLSVHVSLGMNVPVMNVSVHEMNSSV